MRNFRLVSRNKFSKTNLPIYYKNAKICKINSLNILHRKCQSTRHLSATRHFLVTLYISHIYNLPFIANMTKMSDGFKGVNWERWIVFDLHLHFIHFTPTFVRSRNKDVINRIPSWLHGCLLKGIFPLWNARACIFFFLFDPCFFVLTRAYTYITNTIQTHQPKKSAHGTHRFSLLFLTINLHTFFPDERQQVWKEIVVFFVHFLSRSSKKKNVLLPVLLYS